MHFHRGMGGRAFGLLAVLATIGVLGTTPASAAAQSDDVHQLNQLSELPKLKNNSQAARVIAEAYPRSLQRRNVGGRVQLRFVVNADGSVDPASVEVVAAAVPELGDAAKEAAAKLEFVPGKIDGTAVRTLVLFPIQFGQGM